MVIPYEPTISASSALLSRVLTLSYLLVLPMYITSHMYQDTISSNFAIIVTTQTSMQAACDITALGSPSEVHILSEQVRSLHESTNEGE